MFILIPAYNPSENLIMLVSDLVKNNFDNIIVINDGSKLECNDIFKKVSDLGSIVLNHAVNQGKGRAIKTGVNYILNEYDETMIEGIITVDADGQHEVKDISKVSKSMISNKESFILGVREFGKDIPFRSYIGNVITRHVFRFLTGIKVTDTQTGLRAIPEIYLKKLMNIEGERYEYEINMLLEFNDISCEFVEVPISTIYINDNESSHFNPIVDSFKIYMCLFKYGMSSFVSGILDTIIFSIFILLGLGQFYSLLIARTISSFVNYSINKTLVFNDTDKKQNYIKIFKYYCLVVFSFCISAFLINFLSKFIYVIVAKIITDILVFFINYIVQKKFIFNKKS